MRTPHPVQFLDASSGVIRENHARARSTAGAIALFEGLPWPQDATQLRLLDAGRARGARSGYGIWRGWRVRADRAAGPALTSIGSREAAVRGLRTPKLTHMHGV
jgi:hypothetical protein